MKFDPNSNPPSFASDEQVRTSTSSTHGISLIRPGAVDHWKEHENKAKDCRYACWRDGDSEWTMKCCFYLSNCVTVCYWHNKGRPSRRHRLIRGQCRILHRWSVHSYARLSLAIKTGCRKHSFSFVLATNIFHSIRYAVFPQRMYMHRDDEDAIVNTYNENKSRALATAQPSHRP